MESATARRLQRLARGALLAAASSVMGYVGLVLVWGFIYSIGSRVVTDELHGELRDVLPRYGALAGFLVGVSFAGLPSTVAFPALLAVHALAVMAGALAGGFGWFPGLAAFFATLALSSAGSFVGAALVRANRIQFVTAAERSLNANAPRKG
jgi:hypothetical protein